MPATNNQPDPQAAVLEKLGDIKVSVADVARGQVELTKKVDKLDQNINGDGSVDDPGFAGHMRSTLAWRKRAQPTLDQISKDMAEIKTWRENQTGAVKLLLQYGPGPVGALIVYLASIWHGGAPPAALK